MSRRKLKARSRITQKMTKDGLIERNETTGDDNRISKRDAELDLRNAPVDGDISDMSAVPARGEKHSYSQVGNKSDVKTGTRNKHLYRQQYASKEAASSAVQPKVNTESHEQSLSQPIHGHDNTAAPQQELSTARPYEQPLSAQPTHEQETATVPQKEPTATALNERPPTRAAPTDVPSDTATQQSSGGKLKTSKDTSYRHSKQSMLQNTSATSALQNKPPTEPVLKHKSKAAAGGAGAAAITETPITTDNPRKPAKQPAPKLQDDGPIGTSEQAKSQEHPAHSDTVPSDSTTPSNEGDIDKSDGTVLSSDGNTTKSNNTAKPKDAPDPKLQTDKGSKLKFDGDEAVPELPKDRKLIKAAMRTNAKLDKAKADLPTQTKLRSRLTFDEQKGKTKREFFFEKEVKSQRDHIKGPLPLRPIKAGVNSAIAYGHKKVFQHEDENVGVKAGHKAELMAEGAVRKALRSRKTAPYTRVAKLQHKAMKKNINATYRRTLAQNPKLKSNIASRMWQKRKIRKQYAMALRNAKKMGVGVKNVAGMAKTGAAVMLKAKALFIKAKVALKLLIASPKLLVVLLIAGLLVAFIVALFSLFAAFGGGGMGGVFGALYLAEDADIDNAALAYSEWETDLRLEILNAETNHPGFDEYRYEIIGNIGHNPLQLMAFLTAMYHDFAFAEIEDKLRALFDAQYTLTFTPSTEIRTRMVPGDTYPYGYVQIQYEWNILTIRLESIPFSNLIMPLMNTEQLMHFQVLMQTHGMRQHVGSPFPFNWHPFISSHYGWRIHPITGARQLHRGIDIALPTGTEILAAHDGYVTFAGEMGGFGNVVFINNGQGIETRYAHCDTILVSEGQWVYAGDVIATVGSTGDSTGPHLHFEILLNGVHKNPIFFAFGGE